MNKVASTRFGEIAVAIKGTASVEADTVLIPDSARDLDPELADKRAFLQLTGNHAFALWLSICCFIGGIANTFVLLRTVALIAG